MLNADDAAVADLARDKVEQVILCTLTADHPRLIEHQAQGGRAVFADGQSIVLAEGTGAERLALTASRADIDLIQAIAAAWALGMSSEAIEHGVANIRSAEGLKRSSRSPSHARA